MLTIVEAVNSGPLSRSMGSACVDRTKNTPGQSKSKSLERC